MNDELWLVLEHTAFAKSALFLFYTVISTQLFSLYILHFCASLYCRWWQSLQMCTHWSDSFNRLICCFFLKASYIPVASFSQSNSYFLTLTSLIVIVWMRGGGYAHFGGASVDTPSHPPPWKPYCRIVWWSRGDQRNLILTPWGELHVCPPNCFQEGISECIVIAAALCSSSSLVPHKEFLRRLSPWCLSFEFNPHYTNNLN